MLFRSLESLNVETAKEPVFGGGEINAGCPDIVFETDRRIEADTPRIDLVAQPKPELPDRIPALQKADQGRVGTDALRVEARHLRGGDDGDAARGGRQVALCIAPRTIVDVGHAAIQDVG